MSVPQSVLDALHQTIEGLEVAGFDLDVNIEGDRLGMKVVPTAAACEDCLVPKTMFIQMVTDELVGAGVKAILNYAPTTATVPSHVVIRHIDPVLEMQSMTFYLKQRDSAALSAEGPIVRAPALRGRRTASG